MSNRVTIQICRFTDYSVNKVPLEDYWGYRIYDDYDQAYNNTYNTLDEVFNDLKPEEILSWVETQHPDFYESILFKGGLYFCDDWVDVTEQMTSEQYDYYTKN